MPTTLNSGLQLPDKGSVDWYSSMQNNYNLLDNHLENTDIHVTAEDKANWNSKQGSLSQAQLDAIAQVATNTNDIATLQSGKANTSHTHSSSDITDIGDYATKQYVDNSISGLVDNAPAALDTLKELSTALNDDANFASTVTTALSAKANSADLATVATTGSYNDLSNKPTINDSTITIQKNGSTVDTFTTNGSNKTINIPVPTKTSDLTNDSNFVDTSNSAVASGITSAKVTSYDTHIADTDIHVTTADKNKWNNQTYVFRYSSTALTPSSTNSNTLLDNTDNLKVGDKVIDSSGVLFSVTAIDTANSTFTIGTALIDLAQDSDVVHKSGNETISGTKTITDSSLDFKSTSAEYGVSAGDSSVIFKDKNNLQTFKIYSRVFSSGLDNNLVSFFLTQKVDNTYYISNGIQLLANTGNKNVILRPILANNNADGLSVSLGDSNRRWQSVYANNYYYGSNNVEFSTKFVTTDTNQTVGGAKTFSDNLTIYNSDDTQTPKGLTIRNAQWGMGESGGTTVSNINFLDKNSSIPASVMASKGLYGQSFLRFSVRTKDSQNNTYSEEIYYDIDTSGNVEFRSWHDNIISLGTSAYKWKDVQTKLINGLTPSSLGMPVAPSSTSYVDISGYITVLDSSSVNTYTPPSNGYITFAVTGNLVQIFHDYGLQGKWSVPAGNANRGFIPVLGGVEVKIYITASNVDKFWFIPCQGNI